MAETGYFPNEEAYGDASALEARDDQPKALVTLANATGALMSLALIAGVGFWGYDLMLRDVNGVPVVRAATAEMRVRPENPGGQLARHQGLAVNEIAAHGAAAGPVDQVRLAPPAVALAAEDKPVVSVPVGDAAAPLRAVPVEASLLDQAGGEDVTRAEDAKTSRTDVDAVIEGLVQPEPTLSDVDGPKFVMAPPSNSVATLEEAPQPAVYTETAEVPLVAAAGLQLSPRPQLRPSRTAGAALEAAFTPAQETREVDPDAIPSGTRLAQLGAFESGAVARAEWDGLQNRHGSLLRGKSRVVQQAQSGGRTFFRLRAMGFVDLSDARRFCSAMLAEGVDCIPVQVR